MSVLIISRKVLLQHFRLHIGGEDTRLPCDVLRSWPSNIFSNNFMHANWLSVKLLKWRSRHDALPIPGARCYVHYQSSQKLESNHVRTGQQQQQQPQSYVLLVVPVRQCLENRRLSSPRTPLDHPVTAWILDRRLNRFPRLSKLGFPP